MDPAGTPYPEAPPGIPPEIAKPSRAYKRQALAAVAGLIGFALLYLGLVVWLGWTAWRLLRSSAHGSNAPAGIFLAIPPLFLLVFLLKGLFLVRRGKIENAIEIRADEEPPLFEFIRRIADATGAPRPHRVFLSTGVNAGVFQDLSFWNLVWPSKKNLDIGLGLVNVLTLDEFKAVLAHEFGHVAQRTMAVGTWVHAAEQVIGAIVARRDAFDRFLDAVCRIDLRLAWIGWLLRLFVWSIRVLLDTAFRGLLVLQRGLSRQMEFQADLVSVSLCGSDSIVHALRRLPAGEAALERAMTFAADEGRAERPIADLYGAQSLMLAKLRMVWNDPHFGLVPPRPAESAPGHRIFRDELAEMPRMWLTHPPSAEREENAKRAYVASVLDDRSAWTVFADPAAIRRRMSALLYEKNMPEAAKLPVAEEAASAARLEAAFGRPSFADRYRGVYVGRSAVRGVERAEDIYLPPIPEDRAGLIGRIEALYPPSLAGLLMERRDAASHLSQLEGLAGGVLQAPGGVIRFGGRVISRGELPGVIDEMKREKDRLDAALLKHDAEVRTAHLAAARHLGGGWEEHLRGLAYLLHYFEHAAADLNDAEGSLRQAFGLAIADRRFSRRDVDRILTVGADLHDTLDHIHKKAGSVRLGTALSERLGVPSWKAALGEELRLQFPTRQLLGKNWLPAAESWVAAARGALSAAAAKTLDELLRAEDHVARCFIDDLPPGAAPEPGGVPEEYRTLVHGSERPRQEPGWWERFQMAGGWIASAARLGVAGAVLAPAFVVAWSVGSITVIAHNGLGVPVVVTVGGKEVRVAPHASIRLEDRPRRRLAVRATTVDGRLIEEFEVDADAPSARYVYNVASADVLFMAYVSYGAPSTSPWEILGPERWKESHADLTLEQPPASISGRGPVVLSLLTAMGGRSPQRTVGACPDSASALRFARAHALYDPPASDGYDTWVGVVAASSKDDALTIVRDRLGAAPDSVPLSRLEQDLAHDEACPRYIARAKEHGDDGDARYLALRCLPDQDLTGPLTEADIRFPTHPWIRWLVAYREMRERRWLEASREIDAALPGLGAIRSHVRETRLRLRRVMGAPIPEQLKDLPEDEGAEFERVALRAESGETVGEDVLTRFSPLSLAEIHRAAGNLAASAGAADSLGQGQESESRMIAASDGATEERISKALSMAPSSGIDLRTLWPSLALAIRHGRDPAPLLEEARTLDADALARLRPALQAKTSKAVHLAIEAGAVGADPRQLGQVRMVGVILLGEEAPPEWRREAKALLLPWERPYLR